MSALSDWPKCAVCSDRVRSSSTHPEDQGGWCPVEEIERVDEAVPIVARWRYRARFYIIARCSHGGGRSAHASGRLHAQRSEAVDVPHWWSQQHETDAMKTMTFFGREEKPTHRLVTSIG